MGDLSRTDGAAVADPWPGDPAELEAVAARLADREAECNQLRSGLLGLIGDPALGRWLGKSADAFRSTLDPLPTLLAVMVAAYGTAAQAVRRYAQQVRDGQAAFAKTESAAQAVAATAAPVEHAVALWKADAAVQEAAADHSRAVRACSAALTTAEQDLRQVCAALTASRFRDFTLTFHLFGGRLGDLAGLMHMGADVLPSTVDPAKILDTIAYIEQHLGEDRGPLVPEFGPLTLLPTLRSLTPAEIDALIAMMTPEQRGRLNTALGKSSDQTRLEWSNLLLTDTSAPTLETIQKDLSALQPDWHTKHGDDLHWAQYDNRLFGPHGIDIDLDVKQGMDGDCAFISALSAIAASDPGFVQSHIRENTNGTYTVTLYQDGKPVDVTVDGLLPTSGTQARPFFAREGSGNWAAVYEKAYAQLKGGYGNIDGASGGFVGLHDLTGQQTIHVSTGALPLQMVGYWLKNGQAITLTSSDGRRFFGAGPTKDYVDGGKVVTGHEYSVESVDMNADPPTITLRNPWGPGAKHGDTPIGSITLTEAEWRGAFAELSATTTRP